MRKFLPIILLTVGCSDGTLEQRILFDVPEVSAMTAGTSYRHAVIFQYPVGADDTLLITASNNNLELDQGYGNQSKVIQLTNNQEVQLVWLFALKPGKTYVTFRLLGDTPASKGLWVNIFNEPSP